MKLLNGNNLELLKTLEDNSVDSIVTDPPYGLSFMNKKWDYDVPSVELWKECYRVLKPGGYILSFGGTRTYHRMVVNIEDAGFEIRDQIMWIYGSGFPKSLNIGKAVDKLQGNKREVVGQRTDGAYSSGTNNLGINRTSLLGNGDGRKTQPTRGEDFGKITKGQSEYEGWGTALKPANEPICVARKPISENTIADNVLKWGTGGINVDECRIGSDNIPSPQHNTSHFRAVGTAGNYNYTYNGDIKLNEGRFPANIIFECICDEVIKGEKGEIKKRFPGGSTFGGGKMSDSVEGTWFNDKGDIHTNPECPCYILDKQSGVSKSRDKYPEVTLDNMPMNHYDGTKIKHQSGKDQTKEFVADKGGASRFFYIAKVSKKERNMGIEEFEEKETNGSIGLRTIGGTPLYEKGNSELANKRVQKNIHPTVKPINLMTYLCRLVTPKDGVILDPYMGSGSTGIAARLEGFDFIGMEMDKDYFDIAEGRINNYEEYRQLLKK